MDQSKFDEYVKRSAIVSKWEAFIHSGKNVDFFNKEDFDILLDNEEIILSFRYVFFDGKYILLKKDPKSDNSNFIKTLNRLKEIYNQRFNEISNPITTTIEIGKTTIKERLYFAELAGFFELKIFNDMSVGNRNILIAKMFSTTGDYVKKYYAQSITKTGTSDYYPNEEHKEAIQKKFTDLTKLK